MLTASYLGQRVSLQVRAAEVEDGGDGYLDDEWTTTRARISARVRPLQGRDLERAKQIDPRISLDVTLRYWLGYRADLKGGRTRLVYHPTSSAGDDRTLEIVTPPVDVDERHVVIQVQCREVA